MPVPASSFIFISALGAVYHVSLLLGSFSSNSHKKAAVASACSRGTAFLITIYPLCFQKVQSSSLNTRSGLPFVRSFKLVALLFAVEGFPGMSLCALLGTIVGTILGTIDLFSIAFVFSLIK